MKEQERIVHKPRPGEPIVGIECVNKDFTIIRLLRSECFSDADYSARFAYFYEMAQEVRFLHPNDIQGNTYENK